MTFTQRDDELGVLVPFPATGTSPTVASTGEVEATGPVLDGELLTDEQYRRARRLAEFARSRLPARWHDRDHVDRVRAELVGHVVRAPLRYPAAVTRGLVIVGRVWWAWVSVRDFYDAAKQTLSL
jgi:S-DNA-T family DNA segregation ATPase FtsK/SpoIIIE